MSIRSMVNDFLDRTVEARFKRDDQGRLVFFPFGYGAGRMVPDGTVEARLRLGCRRLMIVVFAVVVPIASALAGILQIKGASMLQYIVASAVLGLAMQLYPLWLARGLPRSNERLSFTGAAFHSLERFGTRFLMFGLVTSLLFAGVAAIALLNAPFGPEPDPVAMAFCLLVFVPMAAFYAVALARRRRDRRAAG